MKQKIRKFIGSAIILMVALFEVLGIIAISIAVGGSVSDVRWVQIGATLASAMFLFGIGESLSIKIRIAVTSLLAGWIYKDEN